MPAFASLPRPAQWAPPIGGRRAVPAAQQHLEAQADTLAGRALATGGAQATPVSAAPAGPQALAALQGLGAGATLDAPARQDLETRFGSDFAHVRIHADGAAAAAAARQHARAFTVGSHVVFARGAFDPRSAEGRSLLAHELVHVLQQREGGSVALQRKCDGALGEPVLACTPSSASVVGWQLRFKAGCDELLPGQEAEIRKLKVGYQLKIHGFSSQEGASDAGEALACHRANRVAELLRAKRADCPIVGIFQHREQPGFSPADFWRSVIVEQEKPPIAMGEEWLDPQREIHTAWALYRRAQADPTATNLMLVSAWRDEIKDWLVGVGGKAAPAGAELNQRHFDEYRRLTASAESLWMKSDELLALHKHADAARDTYEAWSGGSTAGHGHELHAKDVPAVRYHVDIFGEGHYKGALNVGDAQRTTYGSKSFRVPNLIHRRFSGKTPNKLPFADATVELVTAESGPIHLPGLAEEIRRILVPGGTVILLNPARDEAVHDQIAKVLGGTVSKRRIGEGGLQTTIVTPR